jgi:hypothetical protein
MAHSPDPRSVLLERITGGISKADALIMQLKKKNSRYITIGIAAGALSTVIAGSAAALGPAIGQGPPAWKLTCGLVAICTAAATVVGGLQKQLGLAERLARAIACAGKLHSLEFALTVGNRETSEVAREYESAVASHADVLLA